jgi:hypothetical protein
MGHELAARPDYLRLLKANRQVEYYQQLAAILARVNETRAKG